MTTSIEPAPPGSLEPAGPVGAGSREEARELASSWRGLTRAATLVAILTAPALIAFFMRENDWPFWEALLVTVGIVIVFRGFADLLFRRLIPWPSLFGLESQQLREEDVLARRRAWFWRFWLRWVILAVLVWVLLQFMLDPDGCARQRSCR